MITYFLRKWHHSKDKKGAVVDVSVYDEDLNDGEGGWRNAKIYVPYAANFAGLEEDEKPVAMAKAKGPILTIQLTEYDDYFDEQKDRISKAEKTTTAGKKKKKKALTPIDDDEEDIPF